MITTSYAYYKTVYGGQLEQADFAKYYKKACYRLNDITNGLFRKADETNASEDMLTDVRTLTCNVVDKLSAIDESLGEFGGELGIKSIKVGNVSKTYAGGYSGEPASSMSATVTGSIREMIIMYCGQYGWGSRWV